MEKNNFSQTEKQDNNFKQTEKLDSNLSLTAKQDNNFIQTEKRENKRNYQRELEALIKEQEAHPEKKLLLHSCCAPCSSYCMEFLRKHFDVTVFYFNPNITDLVEYEKRVSEQKRLIQTYNEMPQPAISLICAEYEPDVFINAVKGYEDCLEGQERCSICFALRLSKTAKEAKRLGMDYFTTTLTISPMKNAALLNEIGECIAIKEGVSFLPSDFKKKNGYLRSIELSEQYHLYRQNYCGCEFSKKQMEQAHRTGKDFEI